MVAAGHGPRPKRRLKFCCLGLPLSFDHNLIILHIQRERKCKLGGPPVYSAGSEDTYEGVRYVYSMAGPKGRVRKSHGRWEGGGLLRSPVTREGCARGGGQGRNPPVWVFGVSSVLFRFCSHQLVIITPGMWYFIIILQATKLRLQEVRVHLSRGSGRGRAWVPSQVLKAEPEDLSPHPAACIPSPDTLSSLCPYPTWSSCLQDPSEALAPLPFPSLAPLVFSLCLLCLGASLPF